MVAIKRPLLRSETSPFRRRLSLFWSDVQYWKWWPHIGITAMLCVVALAIVSFFADPDPFSGGKSAEKCWNNGGRSDYTWNC